MNEYQLKYLDLFELAVGEALHGPKPRPLPYNGRRRVWWTPIMHALCWAANKAGILLCLPPDQGWPDSADTMLDLSSLRNIREVLLVCHDEHIPGEFVECGTWRGGACAYARAIIDILGDDRQVHGCDSFEGLPRPDGNGDPRNDEWHQFNALVASYQHAKGLSDKYHIGEIHWHKGFFSETLPRLAKTLKQIAVLRCDGDMYVSTMDTIQNLYPLVATGGFVIVDDWSMRPVRRAIKDYLGYLPDVSVFTERGGGVFRKREAKA